MVVTHTMIKEAIFSLCAGVLQKEFAQAFLLGPWYIMTELTLIPLKQHTNTQRMSHDRNVAHSQ